MSRFPRLQSPEGSALPSLWTFALLNYAVLVLLLASRPAACGASGHEVWLRDDEDVEEPKASIRSRQTCLVEMPGDLSRFRRASRGT